MIREDVGVSTASVGPVGLGGSGVVDNSKPPKKPKTAFSKKIIRTPAVSKSNVEDYFPEPKSNKKKPKKSLGGPELTEALQLVKFKYSGKDSTVPNPEVMVLDPNYDGQPHWKNYGNKDYVLGYSLAHVANKKIAQESINDITDFTSLLGTEDDQEYFQRLKQLFPESISFIRAYKKGLIMDPKILDDNGNETSIKLSELKSARVNKFGF
jgi:hypothetical protein